MENEAIGTVEKTAMDIMKTVKSDFAYRVFTQMEIDDLAASTKAMADDICAAMCEKAIEIAEDEKNWVAGILRILVTKALIKTTSADMKEMMASYALLASNWNQLAQHPAINDAAQALNNFINYQYSVAATMEVMKSVIERAEDVLRTAPPAFDASRHYLLSLKEKLDRKQGE